MAARTARSVLILCGVLTGVLTAASSVFSDSAGRFAVSYRSNVPHHLQAHPPEHREPTIDGASRPDLVSDERAFSMFLLMAADHDPRAGRSYIRHIFNGKIEGNHTALTLEMIEAVRLAAIAYSSAVKAPIDSRQGAAQPDREALTREYQSKVMRLLGPDGEARLLTTLNARVKPRLRTFSKP